MTSRGGSTGNIHMAILSSVSRIHRVSWTSVRALLPVLKVMHTVRYAHSPADADSPEVIKLAHLSVKEYLTSDTSCFAIGARGSHLLISQTGLIHLLRLDTLDVSDDDMKTHFRLFRYAAEYWTFYTLEAGDDSVVYKFTMDLLQAESVPFTKWAQMHAFAWIPGAKPVYPSNSIPLLLYFASAAGLQRESRALLEHGCKPKCSSSSSSSSRGIHHKCIADGI